MCCLHLRAKVAPSGPVRQASGSSSPKWHSLEVVYLTLLPLAACLAVTRRHPSDTDVDRTFANATAPTLREHRPSGGDTTDGSHSAASMAMYAFILWHGLRILFIKMASQGRRFSSTILCRSWKGYYGAKNLRSRIGFRQKLVFALCLGMGLTCQASDTRSSSFSHELWTHGKTEVLRNRREQRRRVREES